MDTLKQQILSRVDMASDYLSTKSVLWDEYEDIFQNELQDKISARSKSKVFDNKLSTFVLEREFRVMNQMMTGKVKAISKNDEGTSRLMNLVLDKYIIPNANAQFDFLTKCRMIDRYSNVYGNFFALVDWDVKANGYVGPDMWLLNIRDVFPQVGAVSVEDSDYFIVRTWQPLSYFENIGKGQGFKNIGKIIEKLKNISGDKSTRDSDDQTRREGRDYPTAQEAKGKGFYEVYTQFEGDRWIDYVSAADEICRDIKNPHDNGELPVVNKYSIPLLDDFMSMGDFERGKTMQYAINSLWNLYLDAQKMAIFPPVVINKDQIAAMSSIKYGPAEKWLVRGNIQNVAAPLNLTGASMQTFDNTYNIMTGALMNMFGTTTTQATTQTNQEYGKTPQALQMQQARELSRDSSDRYYMEQFLTKVVKKMVNLVSKKQSSSLMIRLFKPEVEDLARTYPEVKDMWDEKTGKLTIPKKQFGSILYDYELTPGSIYMVDQKKQQENVGIILKLFMSAQSPQGTNYLIDRLKQEGTDVKFAKLMSVLVANSGIQDSDKIFVELTPEEQGDEIIESDAMKFQQFVSQMNLQQTPPTPGQAPVGQQGPPQAPPEQVAQPYENQYQTG